MQLQKTFGEKRIEDLIMLQERGHLNLEPGFQRRSVWTESDRRKLIESIFNGYPIPCVFLYARNEDGNTTYDVIDGKQRLETILMFTRSKGFKQSSFESKIDLGKGSEWYQWSAIRRKFPHRAHEFNSYQIQTVELVGDISDIVNVFVRINSTGKPLSSGEKRHARFLDNKFLSTAEKLTKKYQSRILDSKILTEQDLQRMKGTELFAELLMSIHRAGPINKKVALDRAIGNESIKSTELLRITREFEATLRAVFKVFPNLKSTRFHKIVDFYTLFMVMWEFQHEKLILNDRKRNLVAQRLLEKFSNGVDQLRESLKQVKPHPQREETYSQYLLSVQGNTDSLPTRQTRQRIVKDLLGSLFERRDEKRTFSVEQKRILWNSDENRKCKRCKKNLRWTDIAVDHILAHTKGGKTLLANAQLLCKSCNSSKGAR